MVKLLKSHKFEGEIKLLTGMHIGGNKDSLQIGGVDSPVIKVKENGKDIPYVPGSSLKGKLRCLLETSEGLTKVDDRSDSTISYLFGCGESKNLTHPGSLIVRDAMLVEEQKDSNDLFEVKAENSINRENGTAKSPRFIERVLPGCKFRVELILKEYEEMDYSELKSKLVEGLKMLQKDYVGGSGTRGYGMIDFSDIITKLENEEEKTE